MLTTSHHWTPGHSASYWSFLVDLGDVLYCDRRYTTEDDAWNAGADLLIREWLNG